jgi:hypothetical protein
MNSLKQTNQRRWYFSPTPLYVAIVTLIAVMIGCYGSGNGGSTASSNVMDAPNESGGESGIAISTAQALPLYKQVHAACVADIFFSKKSSRDILTDPYFSFVKSLNFNSLQYSGGSTSDHDHVVVGDTLVSGGKGDGYNMRREEAEARGENFETLLDGVGTIHFGKDFFNEYAALVKKLGIRGDIIANVQSGTLQELYWKIERTHAQRVIFGMEQNLSDNSKYFPDGAAYRKKVLSWMDSVKRKYPGIIMVLDAAPVYRGASKSSGWNEQVKELPADEARLYLWDKDLMKLGTDANSNLQMINTAFAQTIPQWFRNFSSAIPGKKVCGVPVGYQTKIRRSITVCSAVFNIGKFYKFVIDYNKANNNFIGYASFMALKSLNRDGEVLEFLLSFESLRHVVRGQ